MPENTKGNEAPQVPDANAPFQSSEADKAKAAKWFARARELFEKRNHEYAIKCFIDGLAFWPEAVEEAHQPLRACAMARRQAGGKKSGMMDSVKYSMTHKDPVRAMLNSEWLWAHDPFNSKYVSGLIKNANKARIDDVVMWAGPIYRELIEQEKKPDPKSFALLKEIYESLAGRAEARREFDLAITAMERGLEALGVQQHLSPNDLSIGNLVRDMSTKLTILKGNYETASSFKDSIRGADEQAAEHDRERMFQSDERLDALIAAADKDMRDNPGIAGKVMTLVELLCRRDNEAQEARAIGVLVDAFQSTDDYRYKMRADDIRMRQLARRVRQARDSKDREAVRAARIKQLQFEIPAFRERVDKYPTDLRIRYEYGLRLFSARKYDEAIPCFQASRGDPKSRVPSALYLGRCFYETEYFSEAISILQEGKADYEITDDTTAKELLYWLGRAQADQGEPAAAQKTYGQLLQLDYNYRDVRDRMKGLRAG
jgi:tetratricopeptide (TPR) repeat protein